MEEMEYSFKRKIKLLATGKYMGMTYYIMNLGTHPTAYIQIPVDNELHGKTMEEIDLDVHGGITYVNNKLWIDDDKKVEGFFIGWDYAHFNDYCGYEINLPENLRTGGKKWTTEEIYKEVKNVIEQIKEEYYDKTSIN